MAERDVVSPSWSPKKGTFYNAINYSCSVGTLPEKAAWHMLLDIVGCIVHEIGVRPSMHKTHIASLLRS